MNKQMVLDQWYKVKAELETKYGPMLPPVDDIKGWQLMGQLQGLAWVVDQWNK